MNKKFFIAISSIIHNNKLAFLCASSGESITNENGIDFEKAIDFLFGLIKHRNNKSGVVFVTYASARDFEFLFSTMPRNLRDKLFQSHIITKDLNEFERELEEIENVYYTADKFSNEFQLADFERHVMLKAIAEKKEVEYNDYKITLRSGKFLTISKNKKSLSIYDIYGFCPRQTLREATNKWLQKDDLMLDKKTYINNSFYKSNPLQQLKTFCRTEANGIKHLAAKIYSDLQSIGINLSRFYNASAITTFYLNKWKAKTEYHNYRYARQLAPELFQAAHNANYGGRSEQQKLGTIKNVNVYDINSAYAHAVTYLPQMLRKPHFVRDWKAQPFSLWFCEYDFTSLNSYIGLLPYRKYNGSLNFPLKGSGWFYQPEVSYIIENYPQMINVKFGYVLDYKKATWTKEIQNIYDLRLELADKKSPLESTIKKALASFYGKFAQSLGKQKYYNVFYAGYITSLTRRRLLEAVKGYEKETICFQTDAIHTTAKLESKREKEKSTEISISNEIGHYKYESFDAVTYIDNGVYQGLRQTQTTKQKTRGLKDFNFESALSDINEYKGYAANSQIFIGYNLSQLNTFKNAEYLRLFDSKLKFFPTNDSDIRIFDRKQINFLTEHLDSKPIVENFRDSANKKNNVYVNKIVMDSIEAMRV